MTAAKKKRLTCTIPNDYISSFSGNEDLALISLFRLKQQNILSFPGTPNTSNQRHTSVQAFNINLGLGLNLVLWKIP